MAICRLTLVARASAWIIASAAWGGLTSLAAQTDPRLTTVVKLAQDGLADSARSTVKRLLAATEPTDSSYAEMLYTSGLVAATDYERRVALRRVVLEFAQSAWADDAILLLAQVEYANGNPGSTVQQINRLLSDYPASSLRAIGAFWGARAAGDMQDGATACRMADLGLGAAGVDVELKNQLDYQKQRCTALAAVKRDSSVVASNPPKDSVKASPSPSPSPAAPVPGLRKGFRVQVVAAPTQERADRAAASLRAADFEPVIVKEGAYFKVRSQAYATRAEAQAALTKIRGKLGGQPFIVVDK